MSAYVVPAAHINAIVSWAYQLCGQNMVSYYYAGSRRKIRDDAKRIASVLYAENVRSVNSRYNECDPAHGFVLKLGNGQFRPVQILKALNGYSYQACEADGWEESEAFAIVAGIRDAAIRMLPGYEDAEWVLREQVA